MKEYKRLTKKENGRCGIDGKLVNQRQKALDVFEEAFNIAVKRLAELEDKIENGTLIELPCKVGEPFYEIDTLYCEYRKHEAGGFTFDDGELIIIDYFDSRYKASEVCFSQAEAEAKLKELKYDILVKYKNNQGSGIPLCKECMKDLTLALFAKLNEIKESENER